MKDESLMPPDNRTSLVQAPINTMLELQDQLSRFLGVYNLEEEEQYRSTLAQLAVESSEALAPFLNLTKPWKTTSVNYEEVDEEIIDVLHYVLTYFNLRRLKEHDILALYIMKNSRNFSRVQEKMKRLKEN